MISVLNRLPKAVRLAAAVFTLAILPGLACAEEYKLPDAAEISLYSPIALKFYQSGVAALDRVNYDQAYNDFARAAQFQPEAVRLNMITAGLALKQGRRFHAAKAKNHYETAVMCYRNVLRQPSIDDDFRRNVENRIKVAIDERDNLSQRDVRREAVGGTFVERLNKEFSKNAPQEAKASSGAPVPAAPTPTPVVAVQQYQQYQQPAQAQPGGYPGLPGAQPAGPQPGFPGQPQQPAGPATDPSVSGMPPI
ncbi:MAG: hypothetical protein K1X53_09490 [Candidatus Sumerlaeaceae bacterium]|nr:hypothetical protein [Candidatus Sumerlaeaceae bacterium]